MTWKGGSVVALGITGAVVALGIAGTVAAGAFAWVAASPSVVRVERSTVVHAPRASVATRIADIRAWEGWPPGGGSAAVQRRFGGPATGAGASVYWRGESDSGRLTVLAATAASVELELEQQRPRPLWADIGFRLLGEGGGTRVEAAATIERGLLDRALAVLGRREPFGAALDAALALVKASAEAEERMSHRGAERATTLAAAPVGGLE